MLDICVNDGYDRILNVEFWDSYFSIVVGYVRQELDNRLPTILPELSFLVDDNHG